MTDRPTYIIAVTPEPSARIPDAVALRRLLKVLLRSYGMRCTSVTQGDQTAATVTASATTAKCGSVAVVRNEKD